jgi:hypothetical protein
MKKAFFFLIFLCAIYSCKKSNQTPANTTPLTPAKITVSTSSLFINNTTPQGSATYSLLSYGYDITGKYADTSAVRSVVFDIAAFDANNPGRFSISLATAAQSKVIYGQNAESFSSQLSAGLTETTGFYDFKGSIISVFSASDAFSKKYVYASYSYIIQQKRVGFFGDTALLAKYVTPQFSRDVQLLNPADLVRKYGTHVLCDIDLGAQFNVIYQGTTSSTGTFSAVFAGFNYALGNVFDLSTGSLDPINKNDLATVSNPKIFYNAVGGDLAKLNGTTADGKKIIIQDWNNSSTLANAVFIDINKNGLIPLDELISDAAQKAKVKAYIISYIAGNQVKLTN